MKRIIQIECVEENNYTVREGDSSRHSLCWDEMLGAIAELTHPAIGSARLHPMLADADRVRYDKEFRLARRMQSSVVHSDAPAIDSEFAEVGETVPDKHCLSWTETTKADK